MVERRGRVYSQRPCMNDPRARTRRGDGLWRGIGCMEEGKGENRDKCNRINKNNLGKKNLKKITSRK